MSDWVQPMTASTVSCLVAAATLAGTKVYAERVNPVADENLEPPMICVYVPSDTLSSDAQGARFDTETKVAIDCWAAARSLNEAVAARNRLAFEAFRATFGNSAWRAQFSVGIRGVQISRGVQAAGQFFYAVAQIEGLVPQPIDLECDGPEDPLEVVHLDYDIADGGGPDGVIDAADDIRISQTGGGA